MRIAIVNDTITAVEALRRVLAKASEYQLIWVARNGAEAVECCAEDTPDLILMDLMMPVMDGTETTRLIMAQTPCAILIVTASVGINSSKVFQTLGAGALDAVSTPILGMDGSTGGADALLSKIRIMQHLIRGQKRAAAPTQPQPGSSRHEPLVVIGASAGGPAALATVLGNLPQDFPAAIVVVQHIDAQFAPSMASWLNEQSPLLVRIAHESDHPQVGTALLAGTNDHLIFANAHTLCYTSDPDDCVYRPSVDILFESVARHRKEQAVGVVLTGMGRDGARGLKLLRDAGAMTIAQDRDSCVVYGMPKAAAELDAAVNILPLNEIAPRLVNICAHASRSRANKMIV